ncbi:MAG: methionine--tRNA ligase [Sarcina sp.]
MKVIVGNAWPYANGSLHVGRVSSWILGDVIARYHRLKSDEVIFVSGADCHGAPILNKAKEMNKSPKAVSSYFYREFKRTFEALDFSFDSFSKTDSEYHGEKVKEFILKLYENGFIYEKEIEEYYCNSCREVIGDRSIKGICPYCNKETTGEQCDNCSKLIEPEKLKNKSCISCGKEPVLRRSNQLFFKLSVFEDYIEGLTKKDLGWRNNAIELTEKYINEGLRDRMLSRDIDWGISVPIKGFEDKKVYVWIEAIMSYLTSTFDFLENDEEVNEYWNSSDSRVYLVHGKENIPFHSVILPSILNGLGYKDVNLRILSSEYVNLEGKKFSSNRNWVVWTNYLTNNYDKNAIRYYLLRNGAEVKNSNFSWKDFISLNNNELLGVYGNFINRIMVFINKYYNNKLVFSEITEELKVEIAKSYDYLGKEIELGNMNKALETILKIVNETNNYFDEEKPWLYLKSDIEKANRVISNCSYVAINLANLLEPFIPEIAGKIRELFNIEEKTWKAIELESLTISKKEFLFERIQPIRIKEELKSLKFKRK